MLLHFANASVLIFGAFLNRTLSNMTVIVVRRMCFKTLHYVEINARKQHDYLFKSMKVSDFVSSDPSF